jgi:hypothetical protein
MYHIIINWLPNLKVWEYNKNQSVPLGGEGSFSQYFGTLTEISLTTNYEWTGIFSYEFDVQDKGKIQQLLVKREMWKNYNYLLTNNV